jgi:hypothetical protein
VATRVEIWIGPIKHSFTGKDVLLRFAYDDAVCRLGERARVRVPRRRAGDITVRSQQSRQERDVQTSTLTTLLRKRGQASGRRIWLPWLRSLDDLVAAGGLGPAE